MNRLVSLLVDFAIGCLVVLTCVLLLACVLLLGQLIAYLTGWAAAALATPVAFGLGVASLIWRVSDARAR